DPERGAPLAWLFTIARHKLAGAVRAGHADDRTRRALAMQPIVVDDEAAAAIERLAATGARDLLRALPPDQRAAVFARYAEDLGYSEIAARLGCSQSVVRKRVSRGLTALRRNTALGSGTP
ncbi:MAG TPA: RNA polymerase sigma factor, partial [Polyangiales bacterium]|nr:RNA polymerase sigma factor [Polyangiales bacterium]